MAKTRPAAKKAATADNPFEKRGILRKKHEVFNRKVKGSDRNVAAARSAAFERRTKTLLVDWKQNKKSNAFEDRRFGEADASLPLEEKMWMRLQRERSSRSRRGAAFNLDDDGEGELLTHKGKALDAEGGNFGAAPLEPSDDESDGALGAEVVNKLHFGGGNNTNGAAGDVHTGPKSRREALEELISKSKEGKREKARRKEDQEEVRDKLDEQMGDLLGLLQQRPTRHDARAGGGSAAPEEPRPKLDDYDKMARELVFDARAQASERTLTPEEAARREKERLDQLEKERLKRMKGEDAEANGAGGKKRKRASNDDELADDAALESLSRRGSQPIVFPPDLSGSDAEAGSDSGEGGGDDEEEDAENSSSGDSDESGDGSDSGEEESEVEGDSDVCPAARKASKSGGGGDNVGGSKKAGSAVAAEAAAIVKGAKGDEEEKEGGSSEPGKQKGGAGAAAVPNGTGKAAAKATSASSAAAAAAESASAQEEIPYVLECPKSMEELLALLAKHAKTAADVNTVIDRVRRYHSVRLDIRNSEKINNLYALLLRRFQRVGEQAVHLPPGGSMDRVSQLDFLTRCLFEMGQEAPDAAGAIWHRTVGTLQQRLAKRLRDLSAGEGGSAWPAPGALLLLRLLPLLFPASDYRHPVTTPAALLLGQCLAQCPVHGAADLAAGLFCAGLATEFARPAGRFVPEAVAFLVAVLNAFAPLRSSSSSSSSNNSADAKHSQDETDEDDGDAAKGSSGLLKGGTVVEPPATDLLGRFAVTAAAGAAEPLAWLRASACSSGAFVEESAPPPMQVDLRWLAAGSGGSAAADGADESGDDDQDTSGGSAAAAPLPEAARPAFAAAVLATTYRLLEQTARQLGDCAGALEALAPVMQAMAHVQPTEPPALPAPLATLHVKLQEALAAVAAAAATRNPLQWPAEPKPTLKALAPKYSERYTMRKDDDEDRSKAELKKMQRQVKREKKGAARELRRDAAFLAGARASEEEKKRSERKRQLNRNKAWLETQQAAVNKQLNQKSGRMAMRGGGSAPKKRAKVR